MDFTKISWLCKHTKKVRIAQASISINSCTELSKTQYFPVFSLSIRMGHFTNRAVNIHLKSNEVVCPKVKLVEVLNKQENIHKVIQNGILKEAIKLMKML